MVAAPGVVNFFIGKTPGGVDVSVVTDGSSDRQQLQTELIDVEESRSSSTPRRSSELPPGAEHTRETGGIWSTLAALMVISPPSQPVCRIG